MKKNKIFSEHIYLPHTSRPFPEFSSVAAVTDGGGVVGSFVVVIGADVVDGSVDVDDNVVDVGGGDVNVDVGDNVVDGSVNVVVVVVGVVGDIPSDVVLSP